MDGAIEKELKAATFPCTACGADLRYEPGTDHLGCNYCGAENEVPEATGEVSEQDFVRYIAELSHSKEVMTQRFVKCDACGASSTLEPNIETISCPYCTNPLVGAASEEEEVIKPKSLLPFAFNNKEAQNKFKGWVSGLWFAPSALKKAAVNLTNLKGVYLPYWTYDAHSETVYEGKRGDDYTVTQEYTKVVDGKTVVKTRNVTKTRWSSVSGVVHNAFDDILIRASNNLHGYFLDKLEPWDLENLVPFDKAYLSGFTSEKYQVGLEEGFKLADERMRPVISTTIRRDIGGNRQKIRHMSPSYNDITFKHLLLPVYISSYKYRNRVYRVVINGRTGEIQGRRPYSAGKITLAVLAVLTVLGILSIIGSM